MRCSDETQATECGERSNKVRDYNARLEISSPEAYIAESGTHSSPPMQCRLGGVVADSGWASSYIAGKVVPTAALAHRPLRSEGLNASA